MLSEQDFAFGNKIFKAFEFPQLWVLRNHVHLQIFWGLARKPLARQRIALPSGTVFLLGQEHAVRELVPIGVLVLDHVISVRSRVQRLHLPQSALRENMIHLRLVVLAGRCVVEPSIPEIEKKMHRI